MVRLVFLGPPGAGKGTQATRIADFYAVPHVSTGDILRSNVTQETTLGQQAKAYMDRGELVPDQLILDMVDQRLSQPDTQTGWILDGFPRNVAQAVFVDEWLHQKSSAVQTGDAGHQAFRVVNLEVPDAILVERLLARGRSDDNEQTIRHRLQVYRAETAPLIEFYGKRAQLVSVNGDQSMDAVTQDLKQAIGP